MMFTDKEKQIIFIMTTIVLKYESTCLSTKEMKIALGIYNKLKEDLSIEIDDSWLSLEEKNERKIHG